MSEQISSDIILRLDKIPSVISDDAFLANKGLSNEVGIHIFCYEPQDEITVQKFFQGLIEQNDNTKFRLIDCNLYRIFLQICEDKRILKTIPKLEQSKGKDFLIRKLSNISTPEAFVRLMDYQPHNYGDVLLISGVGDVYPFMRAHKILDNIQHLFSDIPVLMLYPGVFDGQSLSLLGDFKDGNYYRAFNLI